MAKFWNIVPTSALFIFGLMLVVQRSKAMVPQESCHRRPASLTSLLSSMEPYRFVANTDDSAFVLSGCQVVSFWGLFRHGARYPNQKQIKNAKEWLFPLRDTIVENYNAGKGSLCQSDVSLLKEWKMDLQENDAFYLAKEGATELLNLGNRFGRRFPELFSKPYDESFYEFYKLCDKYLKEVKNSIHSKAEKAKFTNGPEIQRVIEDVSGRLGLAENLKPDVLLLMYSFCGFDTAWSDSSPSPWCAPFTENDLEVIQYLRDLNHFAIHGYQSEITYKQACPLLKNAFDFFKSDVDTPAVKLNFAHADTLLKLLARLGLYKDPEPLQASNYSRNRNRKWKDSVIGPFAANLAFVLFDCGGEKKVLTLHNERPITLPGCPETELCPLKTILKTYEDPIENCNFKEMCSVENTT